MNSGWRFYWRCQRRSVGRKWGSRVKNRTTTRRVFLSRLIVRIDSTLGGIFFYFNRTANDPIWSLGFASWMKHKMSFSSQSQLVCHIEKKSTGVKSEDLGGQSMSVWNWRDMWRHLIRTTCHPNSNKVNHQQLRPLPISSSKGYAPMIPPTTKQCTFVNKLVFLGFSQLHFFFKLPSTYVLCNNQFIKVQHF